VAGKRRPTDEIQQQPMRAGATRSSSVTLLEKQSSRTLSCHYVSFLGQDLPEPGSLEQRPVARGGRPGQQGGNQSGRDAPKWNRSDAGRSRNPPDLARTT
jgi:hypothetical protein